MRIAWSVVSAVTDGLPSRSAPIHDPNWRNAWTAGGRVPVRPESLARAGPAGGASRSSAAATAPRSSAASTAR